MDQTQYSVSNGKRNKQGSENVRVQTVLLVSLTLNKSQSALEQYY